MTTDNEPKMTIEEKIVQTLKDDKLYALVGDEDAITELVKRAITEALYQPQRIYKSDRWGSKTYEHKDSLVVEAGRDVAKAAAAAIVAKITSDMIANPAVSKAINEAIAAAMPDAIRAYASGQIQMFTQQTSMDAMVRVQEAIRNRTIQL